MPDKRYFLRLTGAFLLGIIALIIAGIAFFLLLPVLIPLALGALILAGVFIAIWAIVYVAMFIGVAIYYALTTSTEWVKKDKGYSIAKAKEAGKREKGKSRK